MDMGSDVAARALAPYIEDEAVLEYTACAAADVWRELGPRTTRDDVRDAIADFFGSPEGAASASARVLEALAAAAASGGGEGVESGPAGAAAGLSEETTTGTRPSTAAAHGQIDLQLEPTKPEPPAERQGGGARDAAAAAAAEPAARAAAAGSGGNARRRGAARAGAAAAPPDEPVLDDFAAAWEACKAEGVAWGGRGRGGRGVGRQFASLSAATRDVHLEGTTLAYAGRELLAPTTLKLTHGHVYALIGRNGVGKSTLLRRIGAGALPGFPTQLRVASVAQEVVGEGAEHGAPRAAAGADESEAQPGAAQPQPPAAAAGGGAAVAAAAPPPPLPQQQPALAALVQGMGEARARALEAERDALEAALADALGAAEGSAAAADAAAVAERLCNLEAEIEALGSGEAEGSARALLGALGFSEAAMRSHPTAELSGGWRMRLALAHALGARADVLLLDEPTNHLDLRAVLWLERALRGELGAAPGGGGGGAGALLRPPSEQAILVVSHDADFLRAVATDVIVFEGRQLRYFSGGLDEFEAREAEAGAAMGGRLDARARQEKAARAAADSMRRAAARSAKHGCANENAQRQAKQKEKKIERIGLFREDGHAFKLNSLKRLDPKALRLPERADAGAAAAAARAARAEHFELPPPDAGALRGASEADDVLLSLTDAAFGYGHGHGHAHAVAAGGEGEGAAPPLLAGMCAQLRLRARVGLVGDNGAGKTTLLRLLAGELEPNGGGRLWRRPGLRVAYISQHHAERLRARAPDEPAAHYLARTRRVSELEARSALGRMGLTGGAALQPLRALSGGQLVRCSLAELLWEAPHVLLLDEPTNHLDAGARDALARALREFGGATVVVSHDRAFCAACCEELWVVERGTLTTARADDGAAAGDAPFGRLFARYAEGVLARGATAGAAERAAAGERGARAAAGLADARAAAGGKQGGGGKRQVAASKRGAGAGAARAALL